MNVSNIHNSINFYQKLFGTEPVKVEKGYAKFDLDNPGLVISFIEAPDKVAKDFGHLGFRVNSDEELRSKKTDLEKEIEIALEEENTACCYAIQNKFWVNDPDGYEWEVYHFLEDTKSNEKKYSAVGCC